MRYNRELVETTVKAMKRIAEIKQKREHAFWKNRSVHSVLQSPRFTDRQYAGWLSREKSSRRTENAPSRRPQSSLSSRSPHRRKRSRRRSRSRPKRAAHSLPARVGPWAWRSTEFQIHLCAFPLPRSHVVMLCSESTVDVLLCSVQCVL